MGIPDDHYKAGQSISAFKHYNHRNVCYSFQSNAKKKYYIVQILSCWNLWCRVYQKLYLYDEQIFIKVDCQLCQ